MKKSKGGKPKSSFESELTNTSRKAVKGLRYKYVVSYRAIIYFAVKIDALMNKK